MLRLTELSAGYGAFTAVHELNLVVAPATVFALVGANGAGKSSTIMAIAGHVAVQSGHVELDGQDITALPVVRRVDRGIALAPEGRRRRCQTKTRGSAKDVIGRYQATS